MELFFHKLATLTKLCKTRLFGGIERNMTGFQKQQALTTDEGRNWLKQSFSQSGEDLIVRYIFDSLNMPIITYIDIGAHHPFYLNNTNIFYETGSRGINIEPDPVLFDRFLEFRTGDINLNIGVADSQDTKDFYVMSTPTLNTFSLQEVQNYTKEGNYSLRCIKKIKVDTIKNIVETHCSGRFPDFLNIDAEGVDHVVLSSLSRFVSRPTVICAETISFSNSGRGKKKDDIIVLLKRMGYLLYADTYINSIFVLEDRWIRK